MAQASGGGIIVLDYNFVQGLRPYERVSPGVYRWLSKNDMVTKEWRP